MYLQYGWTFERRDQQDLLAAEIVCMVSCALLRLQGATNTHKCEEPEHFEIWEYCQSTSKVQASELQILRVQRQGCSGRAGLALQ